MELPVWATRLLKTHWFYPFIGALILLLDLLSGPHLLFPILFIVPVAFAAWFYHARMAYFLAVALPFGRLLIAEFVDTPHSHFYIVANALIRVAVLLFMAFLIARCARQTRMLQERFSGLVTMCAWSRTVEYEGQWISFEEYLRRRFSVDITHGISPAGIERISKEHGFAVLDDEGPEAKPVAKPDKES